MIGLSAAIFVIAVLWLCVKASRTVNTDTRQPSAIDRLAAWEVRRGAYRARERIRQESARIAFDERASVQPKINPRLPK